MRRVSVVVMCLVATISCALNWGGRPVQAQPVPAFRWCVDILSARPTPTPIVDLYDRVRGAIEPKEEFETTAAFDARGEGALQKIKLSLIRDFGSGRIVALAPITAPYDADRGSFTIGSRSGMPITGQNYFQTKAMEQPAFELIAIENRPRTSGEYVAQNAYGAASVVKSETQDEFGVALPDMIMAKRTSWLRRHFILPMPPAQAKAIGGKLSILIVGDLALPGVVDGRWRQLPTLQNPKDVTTVKRYVTLTNACGAIVATDTREILDRLN